MKYCEHCEVEIPAARVKARPEVTLCVHCQEVEEREGRHTRTRMGFDIRFRNDEIESMEGYLIRGAK